MDKNLERMSDLYNKEYNPAAEAKSVVVKGFNGSSYPVLKVDEDGNLSVSMGMVPTGYDSVVQTYPDAVTDVFEFKTGGHNGTTIGTVTIVYTDATKAAMSYAERS